MVAERGSPDTVVLAPETPEAAALMSPAPLTVRVTPGRPADRNGHAGQAGGRAGHATCRTGHVTGRTGHVTRRTSHAGQVAGRTGHRAGGVAAVQADSNAGRADRRRGTGRRAADGHQAAVREHLDGGDGTRQLERRADGQLERRAGRQLRRSVRHGRTSGKNARCKDGRRGSAPKENTPIEHDNSVRLSVGGLSR